MDIMEKVEILREKAAISYEEAKSVLEQANGDLLDAMVILERQSKIRKPETEIIVKEKSTESAEEKTTEQTDKEKRTTADGRGNKVKETAKKVMQVLKNNSFRISRKEDTIFMMPAWVLALILLFAWKTVIPVMLISLLFKVRYSFEGKDDMSCANEFMDKVGNIADEVTEGLKA